MTASIDMRSRALGARDQGLRPMCLAFAMSDAHMVSRELNEHLSVEYLHFHAARRAGTTIDIGVGLEVTRAALGQDGQPTELVCAFDAKRDPSWSPPTGLAPVWTRTSKVLTGTPSGVLRANLLAGRANVLVFRISKGFYTPDAATHLVHDDGKSGGGLHAVVVVGFDVIGAVEALLVRNSWGPGWGDSGHAWLPLSYVDRRCVHVVELEQDAKGGT